jgi:hypothetical protein
MPFKIFGLRAIKPHRVVPSGHDRQTVSNSGNHMREDQGREERFHFTGGKIVFQSSFMLITIQPFFFASAMSASLNVPIFDSAP